MNILHITNWFPNNHNKNEAIWIKRHIDALDEKGINKILHFNIIKSQKLIFKRNIDSQLRQTIIGIPFQQWFLFEIIYGLWLSHQLLIKRVHKNYDVINFHIAYPMLTYWHWIKRWVNKPVVITEHWSAYHFNFGVKKSLPRIQRIFSQQIPVIAVSESLIGDIKKFAKADFSHFILPNVVDEELFFYDPSVRRSNFFFMVSQWKYPKDPIKIISLFLKASIPDDFILVIGGFGPQWLDIVEFVRKNDAQNRLELVGRLNSVEVSNYMKQCKGFLHISDYETFSVVCAEAVSCGTPVLASKVGGMREYINDSNGILIDSPDKLKKSIGDLLNKEIDNKEISEQILNKFSKERVGRQYHYYLELIQKNWENRSIKKSEIC